MGNAEWMREKYGDIADVVMSDDILSEKIVSCGYQLDVAFNSCCVDLLKEGHLDAVRQMIDAGYEPRPDSIMFLDQQWTGPAVELAYELGFSFTWLQRPNNEAIVAAVTNGYPLKRKDEVKFLCDTLDADVIESCLKAGVKDVDLRSAREAGRDDLLALYERYGISADDVTADVCELMLGGAGGARPPYADPLTILKEYADAKVDWRKVTLAALKRFEMRPDDRIEQERSTGAVKDVLWAIGARYYGGYRQSFNWRDFKGKRPSELIPYEWDELFRELLSRFDGDLDMKLSPPKVICEALDDEGDPSYWGWRRHGEGDAPVYQLLLDRGAQLPTWYNAYQIVTLFNADMRDLVASHNGVDLSEAVDLAREKQDRDLDWYISRNKSIPKDKGVEGDLYQSGNGDALKWFYDAAPDLIDLSRFKLADLYNENKYNLFIAILELMDEGTLKTPKLSTYMYDFCRVGDLQAVKALFRAATISKGTKKTILDKLKTIKYENEAIEYVREQM